MNDVKIAVPVALFLDDGVHVFDSIVEAERCLEPIDVRKNPKWFGYGYDTKGSGVRLAVSTGERKIFLWKTQQEVVQLLSDPELRLSEDENAKQQMLEYLQRADDPNTVAVPGDIASEELLHRVLARGQAERIKS